MTCTTLHHRDIGHRQVRRLALAVASVTALATGNAGAAVMEFSSATLDFATPTQSIWGGGSAGFVRSGTALGSANGTNVSYRVAASSGTMSARASGRLAAAYEDTVDLADSGSVSVALDFVGGSSGGGLFGGGIFGGGIFGGGDSSFSSNVGASVSITGTVDLGLLGSPSLEIFGADYELDISERFVAETPRTATDSDSFTASGVGVSLPTFGIGVSGSAGVDLDIAQDATLTLSRLTGTAVARHAASGARRSVGFTLDSAGPMRLGLDLGLAGRWDLGFEALRMFGSYSSLFSLDILPFIGGGVGVFCGDPLTDDDNVLCTDDGVKANSFIGIDLFSSPAVALGFNTIAGVNGFSIDVLAAPTVSGVPEPTTLALLGVGVLGLAGGMRRRRCL